MKIVDRATFLSLPAGTVYAKWGPGQRLPETPKDQDLWHDDVAVKCETSGSGRDWICEPLLPWPVGCDDSGEWVDIMIAAINDGTETAPLDIGNCGERDGLFADDQLFAVFNRTEVERLVALFQNCLATGYAQ